MHTGILVLLALLLLFAGAFFLLRQRRAARRVEAQEQPFPREWHDTLLRTFPLYARLPAPDQQRVQRHVQVFLAEKSFEGCGGLEMTDEIRVSIAAQACILLLNLDEADYYADLRSILVYPSTVVPAYAHPDAHGSVVADEQPVLGQSWGHGTVILAWDSVRRGARVPGDGRNVVFHEFAHQLDQESGEADGVPLLESGSALRSWGVVMREHYATLRKAVDGGRRTLLDEYGATNPAEFFAVATEFFFEKPLQLKRTHPALYEELADYYRQDPASWPPPA